MSAPEINLILSLQYSRQAPPGACRHLFIALMSEILIAAAIAFIIGAIAGFIFSRISFRSIVDNHEALLKKTEERHREELARINDNNQRALSDRDRLHNEALELLKRNFDETLRRTKEELNNVSSEILRRRQMEFQQSSSEKINAVLSPLNETIAGMKNAMERNSRLQNEFSGVFSSNVENLLRQSEAARLSAEKLADALGKNTKVQGEWGETVLTELLESQGLTEGRHFDTQNVFKGDSTLRPDVVLHLDNERDVIIDAKASLSDYISYLNAETSAEKELALRKHIASIENHVRELVRKDYSSLIAPPRSSIGYVIMFVPNTSALLLATNARPDLWRKAMEQNVYIADEQTLYAALKIVRLTWSRIAQNENHREVYALANEMLDRVGKFMEKYVELGMKLEATSKAYSQGLDKIKEGGHSIPGTCRKLIRMGAKMEKRKNVPDSMLGLDDTTDLIDN